MFDLLWKFSKAAFVVSAVLCCAIPSQSSGSIASENALAGNPPSEWDVSGIGDPSIQGFATDFSVNRGSTVSFKINTTASAYRIDIYRLGYYGGLGARKVATINPSVSLPQTQPAPVVDAATGLVDCGNWAVSASWAVPSSSTSGVYIARPVRTDTGGASHIVFVVRDDSGGSNLLFQTSDTTWHAYNNYGGRNLYRGNGPGLFGRAWKVSYNRPFNNRGSTQFGEKEGFLFYSEYPMIRWLEANGYNVSYASGMDTDRRGSAALISHKIFLSVGHDEYWSNQQRTNVEAARAAGVHLGFFSGNEMYWKTRWENSIAGTSTAYRTLVCYKESAVGAKIDPTSEWTGTWRDPRFPAYYAARPENAVTGQLWMVNAFRYDPILISSSEGKLRLWRNTGIDALANGQTAQLPVGVLGWEWDEVVDNGLQPSGLFRMSTTTIGLNEYVLDEAGNTGPGIATHSLSLYRHGSGALVFGAGTTNWSWGLDGTHDVNGVVAPAADVRMKQATVNLFADMGNVQPATLQSGLLAATQSTDTTPPTSVILMPPGGTVTAGTTVTTVGTASDAGGGKPAGVEFSLDGGATWHPAKGAANWSATWIAGGAGLTTIKSRAVDDSGRIETPGPGITIAVAPAPAGPIVSLDFNAGSGTTAADGSGQGNDGALLNGAGWTAGKTGTGLSLDGVNDIVKVVDSASLDTATTGITVAAWVYRDSNQATWATVASRQIGTGYQEPYWLGFSNDGKYRWFVNTLGVGYSSTTTGGSASVGQWVHMTGTYDGTTVRLYVNGVEQYAIAHSGQLVDANGGPLTLGGSYNDAGGSAQEAFQGRIDDFQMYNRALSLSEVQSVYAGTSLPNPDTTPPSVTAVSPVNGAMNVNSTTSVTAQFNEAIAPWTIASPIYTYPYPNASFAFNPPTDLAHTDMLRDFRMGNDQQFSLTQVPAGTYDVYVWTFEDGIPQAAILSVEGNIVGTFTSGVAGRWERLGPFRVTVADGDIQVRLQSANNLAYVSGLEVWQGGGTLPPPPPTTSTFYRGINLGGPSIVINGNIWDANTTATPNFFANGAAGSAPSVVFNPALPTANHETMLRTYRYSSNLQLDLTSVPNDIYDLYVWTFEDSSSLNATLAVDGTIVLPGYNTGVAGHWDRLGPYPATVSDGIIQIDYICNTPNDAGVLSGVELWRTSAPLTPPVGTFYRAINVGGPAMVIDGNNWEGEGANNYTVNGGSNPFTLKDAVNNTVPASVSYDIVSRVALLQPSTTLSQGVTYTATIKGGAAGVSDLAGNKLPSDVQWTFTTTPQAAPPTFNPIGGTYSAVQSVVISDTSPGAAIYYTTNGSTPTTASTLYIAPITVSTTTTIKAIAAVSGWINSPLSSATYTIQLPAAPPSGLAAVAISGSQINLTWVDNSTNETGFKIERKTGAGGTYAQIATVGAGVTTYSNTGLTAGTTYFYRVRATNATGDSPYSNEATATPPLPPVLRAATSKGATSGVLSLTITKPAGTQQGDVMVASIAVRPSTATITATGWTLVRRMNNTSTTSNSLAIYYKVAGAGEPSSYTWMFDTSTGSVGGIQSFSGVDTLNPVDVEFGQNTSSSLNHAAPSVTTQFANAMIVTSHAFSSSATFTPPAGMTEAFDVASDTIPTTNGEAIESNYQVQAAAGATGTRTATASNNSDRGNAHTLALKAIVTSFPNAPTGLTATPISSSQINLSWVDNSVNETGFKIERKTGAGGTYSEIATVGAGVTAYSDAGLAETTTYFYRVRAANAVGDSAYSNEASTTTLINPPAAPTGLTATTVSSSQINLTWTDVANETGFKIERKTGAGGTYTQVATVGAGVVTYSNTGLAPNTAYYYRVRATNAGGDSPYSNEANATTLNDIPAAPSGLAAAAVSSSQINLSWVDNAANETGFKIERKTGAGGTYAEIATVGAGVTVYSDAGLAETTTYFYRVRATNAVGDSAYSTEASATTLINPPVAPTGLTASTVSSSQIDLAWTDVANETGFKIERKSGVGGTYSQIATVGAGVVTYSNTGLTANTGYYYRVRATNAGGDSGYSNEANTTTLDVAPAAPSGLTASSISTTQINLSWVDNASNETGFKIERKIGSGGTYSEITTVGAGVTTYSNTGLTAATTYFYRVRATNAIGDSAYSNESSATTGINAPAAPTNLAASAISSTQINLSWTDNATNETGFKIERKTGAGGTYSEITTVGAGVTTYSNTGLTANTAYYYRVRATNVGGDSAYSNEANTTTLDVAPAAPSVLTASAISATQINLSWADNASNETGFKIERKIGAGGTYGEIATVSAGVTTYNNTGLTTATTYFYRVRATNAVGDSAYSNESSATTGINAPAAPTGLTASATSTTQINLSWSDNASNETGFKIERKTGASGTYSEIATVAASTTTYSNTGLTVGTAYYYRVRSTNAGGDSAYSNEANATTLSTLWPPDAVPAIIDQLDGVPSTEVGVRFRSDRAGWITALRFYKAPTNTGLHVGHLWTNTGTLLATVNFTNETASGWQQVQLPTPIAITAGTYYVASYFSQSQHFSYDPFYFAGKGQDRGPLHAPADGVAGGNGLFHDNASAFPTDSANSSNYWVDVVFSDSATP